MKLGLADESSLTPEVLAEVIKPFATDAERRSLADAGIGLQPEGFEEIGALLPQLDMPIRIVYGEQDASCPTWPRRWRGEARLPAGRGHVATRLRALPAGGGTRRDRAPPRGVFAASRP